MPWNSYKSSRATERALTVNLCMVFLGCVGAVAISDPVHPVVAKRAQMHMGTIVTITAVAETEGRAQAAITAGFQEIHRLEELLSTWIPTSELTHINNSAGREEVQVSPETMSLLKQSLEIAKLTEGGFNIAVGPAVEAWNVVDGARIPDEAELRAVQPLTDLAHVHLNESNGTVFLDLAGMRLDVGGIGKGFAADLAVKALQNGGASAGVVALSGDIKTFGSLPDGARFSFGIRHPRKEGAILAFIDLRDEAISTAGDYERFFERNGIRYHHILDPRTLHPARECQSVTIIAKEGVMADGLDTGIFVMGPERGMELVERLPDVEAIIVDREGKLWTSSGLKDRIMFAQ